MADQNNQRSQKEINEKIDQNGDKDDKMKKDIKQLMELFTGMAPAKKSDYKFWKTQCVKQFGEEVDTEVNEEIEKAKLPSEYRQTPYNLPEGFEWCCVDIDNPTDLNDLYSLLAENYVEDSDANFRFCYSKETLIWALKVPDYIPDWLVGIRIKSSSSLCAFIAGTQNVVSIRGKTVKTCDVDFLCVKKELRSKRIAPVLIKELTRRAHIRSVYQSIYTSASILPTPVSSPRYYHRNLNMRKLVDVGFAFLPPNIDVKLYNKLYKLPEEILTTGFREMRESDVPSVQRILNNYQKKFLLSKTFTEADVSHLFIPRPNIISSYVVENDGQITDFGSYYHINSSVLNNHKYKSLKGAYAYYMAFEKTPISEFILNLLITAKKQQFDVFNIVEIMENSTVFEKLKFSRGTGILNYYIFNWKCPTFDPNQIGIVVI